MEYKIFTHPSRSTESIKQGWSWPAFFVPPIWAVFKGLWPFAAGIWIAEFAVAMIVETDVGHAFERYLWVVLAAECSMRLIFGINGNSWREVNLIRRGYTESRMVTVGNVVSRRFHLLDKSRIHPRLRALWHDPVWSKVIAAGIAALAVGTAAYMRSAKSPEAFDPSKTIYVSGCRSAVVTGKVEVNGAQTIAWFEWGPTPALGNATLRQTLLEDSDIYQHLSDLTENTQYYYRLVAENANGRFEGKVVKFVTARC
jgi:hypothetical protein